ncbi:hypothetical protein PBT90_08570 [Algoriphagus halophytocola]|uniref:hypothetical protein n=1 Tax=Algoriphagus halophytocola TaxID=2991499 RepID=UPI0022DD64D3|nr:hypothetical protein [Algoriphagus sp. TR-M9]WBL44734.1 hypothetical protein PBT90_08570 [Algoriphagus sp. TR-M9]
MKRLQVHWAKKHTAGTSMGELRTIGGIDIHGNIWNIQVEEAIAGIRAGKWEFYLQENYLEIPITVHSLNESETFLLSQGHGYLPNLLDELPEISF